MNFKKIRIIKQKIIYIERGTQMEQYKEKIKKRIIIFTILDIALLLFGVGGFIYFNMLATPNAQETHSFPTVCILYAACLSILITRLRQLLKDDKKLKIAYNKENDERLKVIQAKIGAPVILYTSITFIIIGAVIPLFVQGTIGTTICYTLFGAGFIQLAFCACLKLYYFKKI